MKQSVPGAVATGLKLGELEHQVSETRFLYKTPPVSLADWVGTYSLPFIQKSSAKRHVRQIGRIAQNWPEFEKCRLTFCKYHLELGKCRLTHGKFQTTFVVWRLTRGRFQTRSVACRLTHGRFQTEHVALRLTFGEIHETSIAYQVILRKCWESFL
jgi:hypothetical protein